MKQAIRLRKSPIPATLAVVRGGIRRMSVLKKNNALFCEQGGHISGVTSWAALD